MTNKIQIMFLNILISLVGLTAFAQTPANTVGLGAITTGTAGAGRAAVDVSESPTSNPASIPFRRGYFVTTDYSFLNQGTAFNVGLTDNLAETIVPTSMIYTQVNGKTWDQQDFTQQQGQLEVANFYSKNLSVGLGARYQIDQVYSYRYTQTNVLAGGIYRIGDNVGLALVFDNILTPDTYVPSSFRMNQGTSLGANYNYKKILRLKGDITTSSTNSLGRPLLAGGFETYLNKFLVLRFGVSKNYETTLDGSSAGLGFIGPKFAVNYAFYNCTEDQTQTRQGIDLAVPVW